MTVVLSLLSALVVAFVSWFLNRRLQIELREKIEAYEKRRVIDDRLRDDERRAEDESRDERRRSEDQDREDRRRRDDNLREEQRRADEQTRADQKRRFDFQLDARRQAYSSLMGQVHFFALSADRDFQRFRKASDVEELEGLWEDRNSRLLADLGTSFYSADCLASPAVRAAAADTFAKVKTLAGSLPVGSDGRAQMSAMLTDIFQSLGAFSEAARDELRAELREIGNIIEATNLQTPVEYFPVVDYGSILWTDLSMQPFSSPTKKPKK